MVKEADINKDIQTIAEKVGIAVFSYDELHNSKIQNKFHYDYQKVIDKVSRIHGQDMTEYLLKRGILEPLPYGEYRVAVGKSTEGGGGINYSQAAFFSFSSKDYQVQYHELAHSLQKHYHLFNSETIDKLYKDAENRLGRAEKAKGKLVDRDEYRLYLNEMHSESFSYAALMLRAKNPLDFAYHAGSAYLSGVSSNLSSLTDFRKPKYGSENANTKYYTSYSVIKETIKQIWKVRKEKKQNEFFNADGVLNDEKLARLCEGTVVKGAYTPRTLNTLFKNKFFSKSFLHENGWRRDMVKSVLNAPLASIWFIKTTPSSKNFLEHRKLKKEEEKNIQEYTNKDKDTHDQEFSALRSYIKLQEFVEKEFSGKTGWEMRRGNFIRCLAANNGECSEQGIKYISRVISEDTDIASEELQKHLSSINEAIRKNKDKNNPYFQILCQKGLEKSFSSDVLSRKEKYPYLTVVDFNLSSGLGYFPISACLDKVDQFAYKCEEGKQFKTELTEVIIKEPHRLGDEALRESLIKKYAPLKNKEQFVEGLDDILMEACYNYLNNKRNPKYIKALEYISTLEIDKMSKVARSQSSKEISAVCGGEETQEVGENAQSARCGTNNATQNNEDTVYRAQKERVAEKLQSFKRKRDDALDRQISNNMKQQKTQSKIKHKQMGVSENVCISIQNITEFADKYDESGKLKKELLRDYMCDDKKMLSLKYWGKLCLRYSQNNSDEQKEFIKDVRKLTLQVCKDIKLNQHDALYLSTKKHCARAKSSDELVKISENLAKHSRMNNNTSNVLQTARDAR